MAHLVEDLRSALRAFRRRPGLLSAALLTLAVGIGANTAIFSVTEAILIRPMPFPDGNRLVFPRSRIESRNLSAIPTLAMLEAWDTGAKSLEGATGFQRRRIVLTGVGEPVKLAAARVVPGFFQLLGRGPVLGRAFVPAEGEPDAPPVVVLTHRAWQRCFGGDPAVLGQFLELAGESHQVVGVLGPEFRFPRTVDAEVFLPLVGTGPEERLTILARLAPGVGVDVRRESSTGS